MSKKISFGFTKLAKKPSIFTNKIEEKKDVELIECLEGQSIKVIGAVEETKEPLVIPIKDDAKNLLDRIKEARKSRETKTTNIEDTRPDSELTLDELAARQLLQEAQKNAKKSEAKIHSVPLTADNVPLEGEKESTLEDYENVPINDFGMAMLRGMGWKDGAGIGKNPKTVVKADAPELRPKGLGLGATKMVKIDKPPPAVDKEGKELQLVKGAYAKIIAGKYKGYYCEVQGLDEETGRIIVQTKIKQEVLSLNEFLVIPVTKDEFIKTSKVLNNAKYEEYKVKTETKNEQKDDKRKIKQEKIKEEKFGDDDVKIIETETKIEYISSPEDQKPSRRVSRSTRYRSRSRSPIKSQKKEKSKSKYRSRSRSTEHRNDRYKRSESSDSEYDRKDKKKKKKSKKSKKERYDSDSEKEKYRKKKNKKESRRCENSGSDSDKNYKYKDKSKSSRSRW